MIDDTKPENAGRHPAAARPPRKLGRPPLEAAQRRREYTSIMLTEPEFELVEAARLKLDFVPPPAVFAREVLLTSLVKVRRR